MRNVLTAAVLTAASMAGMGQSVEVIPRTDTNLPHRPRGLGDWVRNNNRNHAPKYRRPVMKRHQRLERATGPGSYDEWKQQLADARAAKRRLG